MKYHLTAKITVSAFCDVEADSFKEAVSKSYRLPPAWHNYTTGTSTDENWCVEDIDGRPVEISCDDSLENA